ncbi:hypothetical protein FH972_023010 [Carpinus fangiana]|uniref:HMG box domain-containing protein n=1 Tax=Carpinus fangiana TaxID=176857 RepID=A0A5N6KUJ4_9ROSI|nr:hypothetical protein FH972_023010 [Carpinus fangiana]
MDLSTRLDDLDMTTYLGSFKAHDFDSWTAVLDITEQDLYLALPHIALFPVLVSDAFTRITLGVGLGHRRRAIATDRGQALNAPLASDEQSNTTLTSKRRRLSDCSDENCSVTTAVSQPSDFSVFEVETSSQRRRKYRRRPKVILKGPSRDTSVFPEVILLFLIGLSNRLSGHSYGSGADSSPDRHKSYRNKQWSFAQLAKQIGEDWRDLDPDSKNRYLTSANDDWDKYRKAMEQLKLKNEETSPLASMHNRTLASMTGNITTMTRDASLVDAPLSASMSTFSILSPRLDTSKASPTSPDGLSSPHSMPSSSFHYDHAALEIGRPYPTPPSQAGHSATVPPTPVQGVASAYTWPFGPATPRQMHDMQFYSGHYGGGGGGSGMLPNFHDMAMMQSANGYLGPGELMPQHACWSSDEQHALSASPNTPESAEHDAVQSGAVCEWKDSMCMTIPQDGDSRRRVANRGDCREGWRLEISQPKVSEANHSNPVRRPAGASEVADDYGGRRGMRHAFNVHSSCLRQACLRLGEGG